MRSWTSGPRPGAWSASASCPERAVRLGAWPAAAGGAHGEKKQCTGKRRVVAKGKTDQLQGLRLLTTGFINGVPTTTLQLINGVQALDLGAGVGPQTICG